MPTLLLCLSGPMQSWGTTSRFDQRDTGKEPSKSGVIGLLAAALGYDRENWIDLEPLTRLRMGVRCDRSGVLQRDYQTAGCGFGDKKWLQKERLGIIKADGKHSNDGVISERFYLADAVFLVGLESSDSLILKRIQAALRDPKWPLVLGRKSYMPSESVWLEEGFRFDETLENALQRYRWMGKGTLPKQLMFSFESMDNSGRMLMDQPLSSFSERKFGSRFVISEWLIVKDIHVAS